MSIIQRVARRGVKRLTGRVNDRTRPGGAPRPAGRPTQPEPPSGFYHPEGGSGDSLADQEQSAAAPPSVIGPPKPWDAADLQDQEAQPSTGEQPKPKGFLPFRIVKKLAKHELKKRKRRWLFVALLPFMIGLVLIGMIWFGQLKAVHFGTVMRAYNYARAHYMMKKTFSRVFFEHQILSTNSRRGGSLINLTLGTRPNKQVAQLGQQGRLVWNLPKGGDIIGGDLTGAEVRIDGTTVRMSDFTEGRNYRDLDRRQRMRAKSRFVSAIQGQLGDLMRLQSRSVRFNPYKYLKARARFVLTKAWLKATDAAGRDAREVTTAMVEDRARNIMADATGPDAPRTGLDQIDDVVPEARQEALDARVEGRTPGEVRAGVIRGLGIAGHVSDAVFVITMGCLIYDLGVFANDVQPEREAQMLRLAADTLTTTDQIKTGGDVDAQAVGVANSVYDAVGSVGDAAGAILYEEMTGNPLDYSKLSPEQLAQLIRIPTVSPVSNFIEIVGSISSMMTSVYRYSTLDFTSSGEELEKNIQGKCNILLKDGVQYALIGVDLIIAVVSFGTVKGASAAIVKAIRMGIDVGIGIAISELMQAAINKVVSDAAATAFSGLEQGEDAYNSRAVAGELMAQTSNRSINYGRPMSPEETTASQGIAVAALKSEYQTKSLATRYLAIDNPFSLAGKVVARTPVTLSGFASSLQAGARGLGSMLAWPMRTVGSLGGIFNLGAKAEAADTSLLSSRFGVEEWGWTPEEIQRIDTDPSFELESLEDIVEPRLQALNERYGPCYDESTYVLQSDKPEQCTNEFLSAGNPDYGDDALYWRYYSSVVFAGTAMKGDI